MADPLPAQWLPYELVGLEIVCFWVKGSTCVGSAASGHPNRTHLVWQTLSLTAVKLKVGTHGRVVALVVGVSAHGHFKHEKVSVVALP